MLTKRRRDQIIKRWVGVTVLLSLAAALYLALASSELNPFVQRFALVATLEHAAGIRRDTPVTLAGIPVGSVKELSLGDGRRVRLTLDIVARYQERFRADSRARLVRPMLGSPSIDVTMGTAASPPLADGDTIEIEVPPDIADLARLIPERLTRIDRILANFHQLSEGLVAPEAQLQRSLNALTTLMEGLADPRGALQQTLGHLESTGRGADEAVARLAHTQREVERLITEIRSLTVRLAQGAAEVPEYGRKLETILDDLAVLSGQLREVAPEVKPLVESGQEVLHDTDEVLDAAKRSFLLRGTLPRHEERLLLGVPRMEYDTAKEEKP